MGTQSFKDNNMSAPTNVDADEIIPGTTFPTNGNPTPQSLSGHASGSSTPGPVIDGRPTTITLFSRDQLAMSSVLPSLFSMVNDAFEHGHRQSNILINVQRYKTKEQIIDELTPGVFVYLVRFAQSEQVIGVAHGKRYDGGSVLVVEQGPDSKQRNVFKRHGPVAEGTDAWELGGMAVDVAMQGKGLAAFLMRLVEDEVKRRFVADAEREGKTRLVMLLTTVKEIRGEFYLKRGWQVDYEVQQEKGNLGNAEFTVIHMSKEIQSVAR